MSVDGASTGAVRVTVLGCGGSRGVPVIAGVPGGQWGRCDPTNPKNRRMRPSVLVESGEVSVLVDTSPDLRQQLLDSGCARLDAVLWTHQHADHCHGIDELREICRQMHAPIDAYGWDEHLRDIEIRFPYCFDPLPDGYPFYRPVLRSHRIDGPFSVRGLEVTPFEQDHGYMRTVGYRFGRFAYSTDVVRLDERAFEALAGVDTWMVDCGRIEPPHPVHAHLALTLEWIERVKPRRAYLTHMDNTMDYDSLRQMLPEGIEPAFDGMVIEV